MTTKVSRYKAISKISVKTVIRVYFMQNDKKFFLFEIQYLYGESQIHLQFDSPLCEV